MSIQEGASAPGVDVDQLRSDWHAIEAVLYRASRAFGEPYYSEVEAAKESLMRLGSAAVYPEASVVEHCDGCGHTKGHHGYYGQFSCGVPTCACTKFRDGNRENLAEAFADMGAIRAQRDRAEDRWQEALASRDLWLDRAQSWGGRLAVAEAVLREIADAPAVAGERGCGTYKRKARSYFTPATAADAASQEALS